MVTASHNPPQDNGMKVYLAHGAQRASPAAYGDRPVTGVEQPAQDVLVHRLDGGRVVVRPSGNEPKLKAYLELVQSAPGAMEALVAAVDARLGLAR